MNEWNHIEIIFSRLQKNVNSIKFYGLCSSLLRQLQTFFLCTLMLQENLFQLSKLHGKNLKPIQLNIFLYSFEEKKTTIVSYCIFFISSSLFEKYFSKVSHLIYTTKNCVHRRLPPTLYTIPYIYTLKLTLLVFRIT